MSDNPRLESVRLTDGHVLLRGLEPADVEPMFEAASRSAAELRAWMPWFHDSYSIDDTRQFVDFSRQAGQRGDEYNFGVFCAKSGSVWGTCGLNRRDRANRSANLGYWVRTDQTQRGIATASARLVARFGFDALQLERISIMAGTGNLASQAVARKLGAQYEGVARRAMRAGGQQHDAASFSLIPNDLRDA